MTGTPKDLLRREYRDTVAGYVRLLEEMKTRTLCLPSRMDQIRCGESGRPYELMELLLFQPESRCEVPLLNWSQCCFSKGLFRGYALQLDDGQIELFLDLDLETE